MFRVSMMACPWDLIDEGVESVLDRLGGEVGINALSVWCGSPPRTQLRVREVEPRVFRTRGGLFFQPATEHYAATRCKPVVSGWLKARNPFARIAEACAERKLELRAIVSAAGTGRLARRHPEMACKNALEVESRATVCLANPDVQAYLGALVEDLSSNYPLGGVLLTDLVLAWGEARATDLHVAVPLEDTGRLLLGICFCESCQQRASAAGVDVAAAWRSVRVRLQKGFDRGEAPDIRIEAVLADNVPLADYFCWRGQELSSLLGRLVTACRGNLFLDRSHAGPERPPRAVVDSAGVAGVVTLIERSDGLAAALCPEARRSEVCLPAPLILGSRSTEFVTSLSQAVELGFSGAEIDHYGLLPDSALVTVKRAIRFARRTAGGKSVDKI